MPSLSELRKDIVLGEWVVIATGRARRPHEYAKDAPVTVSGNNKKACPFEKPFERALLTMPQARSKDWFVQVVPNKYPAFRAGLCPTPQRAGPYDWMDGTGFHEVVITRDHERSLASMRDEEVEIVIHAYQERHRDLQRQDCVRYVSIFHNHGMSAGATVFHPHSQIIAIPVLPQDIWRSLQGSAQYFQKHKKCVHCVILEHDMEEGHRVVYENADFITIAPYASKTAFELRIFSKAHRAHFEDMTASERSAFANALRVSLAKIYKGLKNPDYNFFIHTAPQDSKKFENYHWHVEILPKTAIWAGFEIGTGIEISTIAPEEAAKFLRKVKV